MTRSETGLDREMTHTPAMQFKMFQARIKSWDDLFQEAADFSRIIEPGRVVSVSHSCDAGVSVVAVWYSGNGSKQLDVMAD